MTLIRSGLLSCLGTVDQLVEQQACRQYICHGLIPPDCLVWKSKNYRGWAVCVVKGVGVFVWFV